MAPTPEPGYRATPFQGTLSFNRWDLVALFFLLAFCCFLFRDILAGHKLSGVDFIQFYLPMKRFLYDQVHLYQTIPYWNPYIFSGMPYLAHFESTVFYPLGLLFWIIPPENAFGYTMALHFFLGGGFMYLLLRTFAASRTGAFVSSAVFTCNGYVIAILYLGHMSPVQSYVWLPLVITFLYRASQSHRPWVSAMMAGTVWGIQILAGAPQDAFYTFLASTVFVLCTVLGPRAIVASAGKALLITAIVFVMGAGLSCIQIIPAFELIGESVRASLDSYEAVTQASYPPQGIATLLMPHFFGNYADASVWVSNIPWTIPQQNLYVGLLPLALLGFVRFGSNGSRRLVVFGGLTAVLSLVLAFGHHTPLYKLVYILPGFDRFRAPSKIMVLWGFSLALLAGLGMDGLLRYAKERGTHRLLLFLSLVLSLIVLDLAFHADRSLILRFFSPFVLPSAIPDKMVEAAQIVLSEFHRLTILSTLLFLLILLMRKNPLTASLVPLGLCAVLLADLGYVHSKAVQHDDSTYERIAKIRQDLNAALARDKTMFRVGSFQHSLGPNFEMLMGYQTVGGFTALFPSRYYEYIDRYSHYQLPRNWVSFFYGVSKSSALMDLLNLKYEILYANRALGFRQTSLPRALIVPQCRVAGKEDILDLLTSAEFDPRRIVLFEKEDGPLAPASAPPEHTSPAEVEITTYGPDAIVLKTISQNPGYLFLSEMYYPGWKALVDGRPSSILRGNYLFRVIPLPPGRHEVQLLFEPLSIRWGIGLTCVFLVVLLLAAIGLFRERSS